MAELNRGVTISILFFLFLAITISFADTSTSGTLTGGEVNNLITKTDQLIKVASASVVQAEMFASQIGDCPQADGSDPCSEVSGRVSSFLTGLVIEIQYANAALSVARTSVSTDLNAAMGKIGESLAFIYTGMEQAKAESGEIPSSCALGEDGGGPDPCADAETLSSQLLTTIDVTYKLVKESYDTLNKKMTEVVVVQPALITMYQKAIQTRAQIEEKINQTQQLGKTEAAYDQLRTEIQTLEGTLITQYNDILKIDPSNFPAIFGLGRIEREQGDLEATKKYLAKGLASPQLPQADVDALVSEVKGLAKNTLKLVQAPFLKVSDIGARLGRELDNSLDITPAFVEAKNDAKLNINELKTRSKIYWTCITTIEAPKASDVTNACTVFIKKMEALSG